MAGVGNIQVGNNPLWERRCGAGGSIGVTTTNGLLCGGAVGVGGKIEISRNN